MTRNDPQAKVRFRTAEPTDAEPIWRLVADGGVLEQNTPYMYLLFCTHFGGTTWIAELSGELVGFVLAYRPPTHPDTVFVWQVGVAEAVRGRGIAGRLLDAVYDSRACGNVRFLEATVTPSNTASQRLFRGFARRRDSPCQELDGFDASLFPDAHEPERLFRIGPLA